MDDIDTCLCKLIQDLTYGNIESLEEMSDGYLLSNLLYKIDPQYFYLSDKLENWINAKTQLEQYLSKNGLENQVLDFDEKSISEGVLEYLVSAILQILAIYAAFNDNEWAVVSEQFEPSQKNLILPILNPMIADITEEREKAPKNDEMKVLLLTLEKRETELNNVKKQLCSTKDELNLSKTEIQTLTKENKKLNTELQDLHRLKNDTIKQIEEFYANKDDMENENELTRRMKQIVSERDELADKLFRLQLSITDKDNEIEKLNLVKNAYETKKSEIESFTEQVHYYKTQNEKLKADIELKDSKLSALEHADFQINKLKEKVKEQYSKLSELKLEKIENENTIKNMEKQVSIANEKVDFIRQRSNSLNESAIDMVQDSAYVSNIEEENENLKRKLNYLMNEISEKDIKELESAFLEKENQLLSGKVKGLLMHSKSLTVQNPANDHNQKRSKELSELACISPEKRSLKDNKGFNSTLQNIASENSLYEIKADPTESMNILYTVCMEIIQKEMMRNRALAPTYNERKRDIFKQFALSNVMKSTTKFSMGKENAFNK